MLRHALALAVALPMFITACGGIVGDGASEATAATKDTEFTATADIRRELDPCMAAPATAFIDREADEATRRELSLAVAGVKEVRFIGAGEAADSDFRQNRLNVMTDEDNVITSVGCG